MILRLKYSNTKLINVKVQYLFIKKQYLQVFYDKMSYLCLCPPKNAAPDEPRVVALCVQSATLPGLCLRTCWQFLQPAGSCAQPLSERLGVLSLTQGASFGARSAPVTLCCTCRHARFGSTPGSSKGRLIFRSCQ